MNFLLGWLNIHHHVEANCGVANHVFKSPVIALVLAKIEKVEETNFLHFPDRCSRAASTPSKQMHCKLSTCLFQY